MFFYRFSSLFPLIWIFLAASVFAQTTDKEQIRSVCQMYIDGFIDGDAEKIKASVSPQLYKFGLKKSADTGEYFHTGVLNAVSAADLALKIGEGGGRRDPNAPEAIEILDIQGAIASVKITAIWGYDYALLAKQNGQWQIEQILWVGPLEAQD